MGEVDRPRSRIESEMSEDEVIGSSIVCDLEAFDKHETGVQNSLGNMSGAAAKRKRNDGKRSDSDGQDVVIDDDGFTLVQKKTKKLKQTSVKNDNLRGYDLPSTSYKNNRRNTRNIPDLNSIEVCVTSNEVLPKQIGLAKLLKSENIPNITEIKYKTPHKILLTFENRADAEKLLCNSKFIELGYKCRFTNEVSLTYGLVRYIEKEIEEEELLKSFSSEFEITSVKRLRRIEESGVWKECETVRFCFKSNTLPQYIYGYDCRFKVEPYTFPVNQCSVCWKFGHLARMCPGSKKKCPKCCGEHENCETINFRCINCKGDHMAFDKKCPRYLKEKKIRQIMCEQNCTYKVAHAEASGKKSYYERENSPLPERIVRPTSMEPIVIEAMIHNEFSQATDGDSIFMEDGEYIGSSEEENKKPGSLNNQKKKKSKSQKNRYKPFNTPPQGKTERNGTSKKETTPKEDQEQRRKNREDNNDQKQSDKFSYIYSKMEKIFFAKISFEEKIKLVIKFCLDEVTKFFVGVFSNGETIRKLINLFHYG